MKNILLFSILVLVTISACEKDNEDGKAEEIFKYNSILAGDITLPGMVYNDIPDTTIYSSGNGWAGSFSYSDDISLDVNNDGVQTSHLKYMLEEDWLVIALAQVWEGLMVH